MSPGRRPLRTLIRAMAVLVVLVLPRLAQAGNARIPPGQEERIRTLVEEGLKSLELDEPVAISIDRDRIHIDASPALTGELTLFHPSVELDDPIGPAMILACDPEPCTTAVRERWLTVVPALDRARDGVAAQVWVVGENDEKTPEFSRGPVARWIDPAPATEPPRPRAQWLDRLGAMAAVLAGLVLAFLGVARRRPGTVALSWYEVGAFVTIALVLVGATAQFTVIAPLHEHNSFLARTNCALDVRCTAGPGGAWSLTTFNTYSMLLAAVPPRSTAFARLSLALSVVNLALLWGLGRTLMRALGEPRLGPLAGLSAAGILALHPVFWRLAGSASFWPWTLTWALGACLAALWASVERRDGRPPWVCAAAWIAAAVALAIACGGNIVCLTLGALLVAAPLGWAPLGNEARDRWRTAAVAVVAVALFVALVGPDYLAGVQQIFDSGALSEGRHPKEFLSLQLPLLARPSVSTLVWLVPGILSFAWLRRSVTNAIHPVRVLAPIWVAWWFPAAYLNLAAGHLVGSGYPVGFINHHWELTFSALWAGLGVAWLFAAIQRRWPNRRMVPTAAVAGLVISALATTAFAREGWRMATGSRVNERELLAIETALPDLPEHDLFVVAPWLLEPIAGVERRGDLIEVVFPWAAYDAAMRANGREPARVVRLGDLPPPRPGDRYLLYLGSSLRSFLPEEIEHGLVPDELERPDLLRLRETWSLEPVHEFMVETAQHEAISNRLGADRVPEIELGFYRMRPK